MLDQFPMTIDNQRCGGMGMLQTGAKKQATALQGGRCDFSMVLLLGGLAGALGYVLLGRHVSHLLPLVRTGCNAYIN